jgi:hypothetical protein
MNDETLLGYLLDALDRDARQGVEAYLRVHPDAYARLAMLGRLARPLAADADAPDPPAGLAESTLARVAGLSSLRLPAAPSTASQAGAPRRGLRPADFIAASLILVLAAGLCLTWLAREWRDYRILACQNNLHRLWTALQVYADQHPENGGSFPRVEPQGPHSFAGVFVPVLTDSGALGRDAATVCPGRDGRASPPCSLAALDDLALNRPREYRARVHDLGGDYAYSLGYRRGDELVGLSRDAGDLLPILADKPRDAGLGNSPNHGGAGQNVLYIGGPVRWCPVANVGVNQDDIYRNISFQVFAGEQKFDTVLGSSDASPCPNP